jgi:hypothetical protein
MSTNRDPRLLTEEVTKQGEVFRGWRVGRGNYFPSSLSSFTSSSSSHEDSDSEGASSPHALTAIRAALLCRLLWFHACRLLLSTRLASCLATSLGKVTPRGSLRTQPRPCIRTHVH